MTLRAIKAFLYNNRRLLPGEDFETKKPIHGTLLIAAKKAREIRAPGKLSAPPLIVTDKLPKGEKKVKHKVDPTDQPPAVTQPSPEVAAEPAPEADDMAALRAEYKEKVGKQPYMGWDAETLHAKMTKNEPVDVGDDAEEVAADDAAS